MSFESAFYLALIILAAMMAICLTLTKRGNRMLVFTVGIWLMVFVLFFPFAPLNDVPVHNLLMKTFLVAVQAFKVFGMYMDSTYINELKMDGAPEWLPEIYCTLVTVIYLAAPVITAGYLLRYVHGVRSWWRFLVGRGRETWFFSGVSEKALLLAKDALNDKNESIRVVFCGVKNEDYGRVHETGAIPFSQGVQSLREGIFQRRPSTVLFMMDDDEQNLDGALQFIERHHEEPKSWLRRRFKPIFIYVFTAKPEANLLLNAADKGRLMCRRVAENRTLVYAEIMAAHPAIWAAAERNERGGKKRLTFLLVGCGWIGMELAKTLLWMYGQEDCQLTLRILDKGSIKERFLLACPGLAGAVVERAEDHADKPVSIEFLNVNSIADFGVEDRLGDTDFVFIALGDNAKNLECAVYLRRAFRLIKRQKHPEQVEEIEDFSLPHIHTVVGGISSKRMNFTDESGRSYGIMPFAGNHGFYTMDTMLNYDLEKLALITHLGWKSDEESRELAEEIRKTTIDSHRQWRNFVLASDATREFYTNEYSGSSSRASAMFRQCFGEVDRAREHQRWNMYMLGEGYQTAPGGSARKIKDSMARIHWEVTDYSNLTPDEDKQAHGGR